jgi:hypothetical protein
VTEADEIVAVLRAALPDLKRRWPITSLAVFGSVTRGEASAASDLDVLVEFARPLGLSEFLALEDALSALVRRRVDLVTRTALKPYIGRRVLDEAVVLLCGRRAIIEIFLRISLAPVAPSSDLSKDNAGGLSGGRKDALRGDASL